MIKETNDVQTEAMLVIIDRFVTALFPRNAILFEKLERDVFQGDSFARLQKIVDEEIGKISKASVGRLLKDYSTPNIEEALWYTLRVLFHLNEKSRLLDQLIDVDSLRNLLQNCATEANIPRWLEERIITHLPKIVVEEFVERESFEKSNGTPRGEGRYAVFKNSTVPRWKTEAEIEEDVKNRYKLPFNIYVNDVLGEVYFKRLDVEERIVIKPILAGKTFTYCTLILLLIKIGSSWEYSELGPTLLCLIDDKRKDKPFRKGRLIEDVAFNINKSISRIKGALSELFGRELVDMFIDSQSHGSIHIKPKVVTSLKTYLILNRRKYENLLRAIEFGKSQSRASLQSGE